MTRTPYPRGDRNSSARSARGLLPRISHSAGSKAGYKQLIRELGLGGGRERRLLVEQLNRLVERKELAKVENEMWAIPKMELADSAPKRNAMRSGTLFEGMEAQVRSGRDRLI